MSESELGRLGINEVLDEMLANDVKNLPVSELAGIQGQGSRQAPAYGDSDSELDVEESELAGIQFASPAESEAGNDDLSELGDFPQSALGEAPLPDDQAYEPETELGKRGT